MVTRKILIFTSVACIVACMLVSLLMVSEARHPSVEASPPTIPAQSTQQIELACKREKAAPAPAPAPTPQPTPEIENYDYVVRVVMAESGNQSLEGQMAVAQCIANTSEVEGMTLYEVVTQPGQYADPYPGQPNAGVMEACERVFKNGERVVEDAIRWFYNPSRGYSAWHESKTYVATIGDHRFFA